MKNYIGLTFREFVEDKILYHGSKSPKLIGDLRYGERDNGWFGTGFYLTSNLNYAKKWGEFIYAMKAPLKNCAEVSVFNNYKIIIFHGDAKRANEIAGNHERWILDEQGWSRDFSKYLKNKGYEGVRVHIDRVKDAEVVIFDPKKIEIVSMAN